MLSTTLAHDIRAPLSVVIMTLAQLKERLFGEITSEQETVILAAHQSAQHALNLTSDFFDLIKLELKKLTLHPEQVTTPAYL